MHIRVFSTAQCRHVCEAVYEYWQSSHALFRVRTIRIISQLRVEELDGYARWVAELVRRCTLFNASFLY